MSLGMSFARRRMMGGGDSIVADPILNNNSWDVISKVSSASEGANFWSVGDRKAIVLNGKVGNLSLSSYTIYAFILGFDHNASQEGSGLIHFQIGKTALSGGTDVALVDSKVNTSANMNNYFVMNRSATNSGGWESSQMRTNICGTSLSSYSGTILAVIPAELRAVIKAVTKYTDNTGSGSTAASAVTKTTDYFFLLSEYEVFGRISQSNTNEKSKQKQYAYYSAGNSRIKRRHNSTYTGVIWWLRSPVSSKTDTFVRLTDTGEVSTGSAKAGNSYGFAPGFCV